jgi:arabinose-5-phosphate isomerase
MHSGDQVAWVSASDALKQVVIAMSRSSLGAACVVSAERRLEGLITDGDLRRTLETCDDIREFRAGQIMTRKPVTISPTAGLREALRRMEDRPSQISVLAVVDKDGTCMGLIRLHDVYLARKAGGAR